MNSTPQPLKARTRSHVARKLLASPIFCVSSILLLVIVASAALSAWLVPFDPDLVDLSLRMAAPSWSHWLGCDLYGRDVFQSLLMGARTTLYVAFLTVSISTSIGIAAGLISGYYGGFWDSCIMRLVDILMAFPGILLTLALASLLGPSLHNVVIAIAATGWTGVARLVRGQVLSLRQREFVTASIAIGALPLRTMARHILPSLWTPIIITATFSLSGVILVEASLSFLGLGAQDSTPTWGSLLNQGRSVLTEAPHLSIVPGLMIMLMVLVCNFLGDALRDALDPKEQ